MAPQPSNTTLRRFETIASAANRTQMSRRWFHKQIAEGRLLAYRAGRSVRLNPDDVDALFVATNSWAVQS